MGAEEARVVDTWLLARGDELLLSPGSTMGYLVVGLAEEFAAEGEAGGAPVYTLHNCKSPPSRDATFHLRAKALKRSKLCQHRDAELTAELHARPESLNARLWNASKQRW